MRDQLLGIALRAEACLKKQASWLLQAVVGGGLASDRWLACCELAGDIGKFFKAFSEVDVA
jgi:hypothetical protein